MRKFFQSILTVLLSTLLFVPMTWAQDEDEFSDLDEDAASYTASNAPAPSTQEVSSKDLEQFYTALKRGSEDDVVRTAAAVLSKDKNNLEVLNGLGVYYLGKKKYGLAKIIINRALKSHASEPSLHNNLGVIYLEEGDVRSALESFRKSLAGGGYRLGASNLASIYLESRDYKRAVGPLEDAYDKLKSEVKKGDQVAVEVATNYAVALMGTGNGKKSEDVFETIVQSGNRDPVVYINYAILLVEVLDKKKDAQRVLSKLQFMTEDKKILRRAEELERRAQ